MQCVAYDLSAKLKALTDAANTTRQAKNREMCNMTGRASEVIRSHQKSSEVIKGHVFFSTDDLIKIKSLVDQNGKVNNHTN